MAAPAVAVPEATPARPDRRYLYGLDALRILAALFIIYRHVGEWLWANGFRWPVDAWMGEAFREPLRLNTFFGFVGLSTLFLISGLVITYVTDRERPVQFLLRRASRLLPAFWAAVCVAWVLVALGLVSALGDAAADLNSLFGSLTLANFFLSEQRIVLGVTWTLTVQLTFFVYVGLTLPWGRRWPWLPPAVAATALSVALSLVNTIDGIPAYHLRTILTYLPVLFVGQLVSLVRSGRLGAGVGVPLGAVHFLLFVRAGLTSELIPSGDGHVRTLLITTLVVVLLLSADGRLARSRLVGAVARRTYALYLIHVPVGFAVLGLLAPHAHLAVALPVALLAMGGAAELLHRYVELPCHRRYRAWERRRGPAPAPPASTADEPGVAVVTPDGGAPPAGSPSTGRPGETSSSTEDDQLLPGGGTTAGGSDASPDSAPALPADPAVPPPGPIDDDPPSPSPSPAGPEGGTSGSPDDGTGAGGAAAPGPDGPAPARDVPDSGPGPSEGLRVGARDDTDPVGHAGTPDGPPVSAGGAATSGGTAGTPPAGVTGGGGPEAPPPPPASGSEEAHDADPGGVVEPLDAASPRSGSANAAGEGR
ncbi:acyltransferase family protein [Actinoalloteichus spitiensis]|uniref:acyltransferase family protein n=1 Tax=Actinoalloteichus spitiensis TaxID=252394 RepID=UPI00035FF7E9|nr:acyltransferase [Actinoalloteichus spitiensis]